MNPLPKNASLRVGVLALLPTLLAIPAWGMAAGTRNATMHTVVLRYENHVTLARVQAGYICLAVRGYTCLPLRWHGARSVDIVDRDGVLFSNGKALLLDLNGMSASKALAAINTHSSTIETIAIGKNEPSGVVAALNKLSKKRLAVAHAVGWPSCSPYSKWKLIYRRVRALSVRRGYAIVCPNLFPKLEHLHLSSSTHFDNLETLQRLPSFSRLRHLTLSADLKGERLSGILGQLQNLEILELISPRLSAKAFLRVVALPKLRGLHLYGPRLEKGSWKHLRRARDLTALEIRGGNGTSSQLVEFIRSAKGLRALSLDPVPNSTRILRAISEHVSLKHLALWRARLGRTSLLSLKRLKRLEQLTIRRVPGPTADLSVLGHLPKLEHLKLIGFKPIRDIRWLHGLPNLTSLQLNKVHPRSLKHARLAALKRMIWLGFSLAKRARQPLRIKSLPPQLRCFTLKHGRISNESLASLSRARNLKYLAFYTVPLRRRQARLLSRFPELEAITLSHAGIDNAALIALSQAPKLDILAIVGSNIAFDDLVQFLRRTNIRRFRLLGSKLTETQAAQLRTLRKELQLELKIRVY